MLLQMISVIDILRITFGEYLISFTSVCVCVCVRVYVLHIVPTRVHLTM